MGDQVKVGGASCFQSRMQNADEDFPRGTFCEDFLTIAPLTTQNTKATQSNITLAATSMK